MKYYYQPKHKDVRDLALKSWHEYIKGKPRIYDMDVCLAYQRGYISAWRHSYAKAMLESAK